MDVRSERLERLYIENRPGLLSRLARRLGSHAVAADLVQDIFLRLWERPQVPLDDAGAYLGRSANNALIDHVRAERVRRSYAENVLPEQYAPAVPSPQDIVAARQELRRLDEVIRALPERTRHVFLLNRVHGKSYAEIAMAMGISRSAVEKHVARAVAACRGVGFSEDVSR